jgi:hypothetical protein
MDIPSPDPEGSRPARCTGGPPLGEPPNPEGRLAMSMVAQQRWTLGGGFTEQEIDATGTCGPFHPLSNDVAREMNGKRALNIPFREEPRWG